jgi:hypothetical protein
MMVQSGLPNYGRKCVESIGDSWESLIALIVDHDHLRVVVAPTFAWHFQRHFLFIGSRLFNRDKSQAP